MHLSIRHETRYDYAAPLEYAHQTLCLTPPGDAHQQVGHWALQVPGTLFPQFDGYGNQQHTWSLGRRLLWGVVQAQGSVETNRVSELHDDARSPSPQIYLRPTPLTEADAAITALGRQHLDRGSTVASIMALTQAVALAVRYRSGTTSVATTARAALAQGQGVCQDQSHVMIAACRSQGVPARYVSGYFYAPDAPSLAGHAWVDVCIDVDAGRWISIDITHLCPMDERHVRLAVGPDYAACSPIRGVRSGGGEEAMKVVIRIDRVEAPGRAPTGVLV